MMILLPFSVGLVLIFEKSALLSLIRFTYTNLSGHDDLAALLSWTGINFGNSALPSFFV